MYNALGQVWLFARDAAGRVIQETDFSGLVFNYTYDTVGRVIKRQHCDGSWLDYFYDKSGLLIKEQAYGADGLLEDQTTFHYDNRGMLIRSENKSATLSFKRDAVGRMALSD